MNNKKILIFLLNEKVINSFFINHIRFLSKKYHISFATSENKKIIIINNKKFKNYYIQVKRNFDILNLTKNIYILLKILKKNRYQFIISLHPKIGLISAITSFFYSIIRIHIFTGQIWSIKRNNNFIFKIIDKIIFNNCDFLLADSSNQIKFLLKNGFIKKKITLLNNGSIRGVGKSKLISKNKILSIKQKYNIPISSKIILYSGRINFDKGIDTLIKSFVILQKNNYKKIYLLIIGDDEIDINSYLSSYSSSILNKIVILPYTNRISQFYSISDIFCLPSLREGFGMSVIEASFHSLPVVVSDIYGLSDSYLNNHTGLNFKVSNEIDLSKQLLRLLDNANLGRVMGANGKKFVKNRFSEDDISKFLLNYIERLH